MRALTTGPDPLFGAPAQGRIRFALFGPVWSCLVLFPVCSCLVLSYIFLLCLVSSISCSVLF